MSLTFDQTGPASFQEQHAPFTETVNQFNLKKYGN